MKIKNNINKVIMMMSIKKIKIMEENAKNKN